MKRIMYATLMVSLSSCNIEGSQIGISVALFICAMFGVLLISHRLEVMWYRFRRNLKIAEADKKLGFSYESNLAWGRVDSVDSLKEKMKILIDSPYTDINTPEDFLEKSKKSEYEHNIYGTRSHHSGQSLRDHLKEIRFDLELLK